MSEYSDHNSELRQALLQGETEIETGEGYDLEMVLAEADVLLRGMWSEEG